MTEVVLQGKRVRLDPNKVIGSGGEADVFDVGNGLVLKLFKPPTHPDFEGDPAAQRAAETRIREHQKKLPLFPKRMPPNVVGPRELARDRKDQIIGYTMSFLSGGEVLLRYSDLRFRAAVPNEEVGAIFRDMHGTVRQVHDGGVVIGDFNDLNVLVRGREAFLIDADSMQYGGFNCSVFTMKFVDPLLCDPAATSPQLVRPHNPNSDWYAFNVMVWQSLLFVDPYGGIFLPKDKQRLVKHNARPLKRITVFDPEVRYPKPAVPYGVLPDDLLHHFYGVFTKDARGMFPLALVEALRWTKCTICGVRHARVKCPVCDKTAFNAVKETTVVRGTVTATRFFKTSGAILAANVENGQLLWLYHANGNFHREGGDVVIAGNIDPLVSYRLQRGSTYLAKADQVVKLTSEQAPVTTHVDTYGQAPVFGVNQLHVYWTQSDRLNRDGLHGSEYIGDVLSKRTLFWVGPAFGFGFYQVGQINVAFTFDATTRGINDGISLPRFKGKLIDATCRFTADRCWFFVSTQEGPRTINRCFLIRRDGTVEASAEAEAGDGSWLTRIKGAAAAGTFLLVPTDDGVVRVEASADKLIKVKEFPDTEPFVSSGDRLFVGRDGLYVVKPQEIIRLVIK